MRLKEATRLEFQNPRYILIILYEMYKFLLFLSLVNVLAYQPMQSGVHLYMFMQTMYCDQYKSDFIRPIKLVRISRLINTRIAFTFYNLSNSYIRHDR